MTLTNTLSTGARIHAVNKGRVVHIPDVAFELVVIRDGVETVLVTGTSIREVLSLRKGFGLTNEQAIALATAGKVCRGETTFVLRAR